MQAILVSIECMLSALPKLSFDCMPDIKAKPMCFNQLGQQLNQMYARYTGRNASHYSCSLVSMCCHTLAELLILTVS